MASLDQLVTSTPTALAGITAGDRYFLQNSGGTNNRDLRVSIKTSVAEVERNGGFTLGHKQGEPVSVESGESVFVWHDLPEGNDFYCSYDEEA